MVEDSTPEAIETVSRSRPSLALLIGFVWLLTVFSLGVVLRFAAARDVPEGKLEQSMRFPERLALLAQYAPDLSPSVREQLLEAAKEAESEKERLRVLDGDPLTPSLIANLPDGGYRQMAQQKLSPTAEGEQELRRLALLAQQRLMICLGLLGTLVLCALALALFGKTVRERSVLPIAATSPMTLLALFFGWDVLNVFGISLMVEGFRLRVIMAPLLLVVAVQMMGYALLLIMLKRARRPDGSWNLILPFPAAWVGRGYFACYGIVLSVNLLLGMLSGESPTSSNPLLGMFLEASSWQIWTLTILVVLVGPFFEELLFRGWLLGGLREHWGDHRALVVSSALFAVIHGDLWATPALFSLGLVFGWVYLRTGSLYASIVLHAMWNGTTFIFLLANMP